MADVNVDADVDVNADVNADVKTIEVQMPHMRPTKKGAMGVRLIAKNETGIRKICSSSRKWKQDILLPEEQIAVVAGGDTKHPLWDLIRQQIATKLAGYRGQDSEKGMLDDKEFITIEVVCEELVKCGGKCYYCGECVKILYTVVRDRLQWTVDRIYNNRGHNRGNFVIACLGCNLHRRCRNADEFNATSNMVVIKGD